MTAIARRVVEGTEANLNSISGRLGAGLNVSKDSPFIQRRFNLFEQLYKQEEEKNKGKQFLKNR